MEFINLIILVFISSANSSVLARKPEIPTVIDWKTQDFDDGLTLEQLKHVCFPTRDSEYERKDVTYVTMFGNEVKSFLNHTKDSNITKLHISIKGANPDARDKNIMYLDYLQGSNIEELWIVPSENTPLEDSQVYYFKLRLSFMKHLKEDSTDETPLSLKKLYIHVALDEPEGLVKLLQQTKYLSILSLVGTQSLSVNSALKKIMMALTDQPISILRLNQYQDEIYEDHINMSQLFTPLQNSTIQCLSLRQNELRSITPGITVILPRLRILDLSYNYLVNANNVAMLLELLTMSKSIELINLSTQGDFQPVTHGRYKRHSSQWLSIPDRIKECFKIVNTNLIKASLNRTAWCQTIQCLNMSILHGIPCSSFPSVQQLFRAYDVTCYPPIKLPVSPNLKELYLDYISSVISVKYNHFEESLPTCIAENQLSTLTSAYNAVSFKKLYFDKMLKTSRVRGMTNLFVLDMSFGKLRISPYDSAFLKSVTQVKNLYVQGNFLDFEEKNSSNTLQPRSKSLCTRVFPQLKEIDFSNTNISVIPKDIFYNCSYITRINLAQNDLTEITLDINKTSPVEYLNLSYNQIKILNKDMRQTLLQFDHQQGLLIDLYQNQMVCDCTEDAYKTIELIQQSELHNITFYQRDKYECIYMNHPNQFLVEVNLSELRSYCQPSYYKLLAYISVSLLIFLLMVITLWLVHKYRYHIYTWYYRCGYSKYRNKRSTTANYKYDAFISYCAEDRFWVHDVLMTTLQNKYGFKLVIHLRDFLVGEHIDDEIVRHMALSRTNVIIMSDNSVKKQWPEFELKRAYTESHTEHKPLIVVKFGRISTPKEELSGLVQQILDSKVYNEWPEFSENSGKTLKAASVARRQELFWEKLAQAIYRNSQPLWGCGRCQNNIEPGDFNDMLLNDLDENDD